MKNININIHAGRRQAGRLWQLVAIACLVGALSVPAVASDSGAAGATRQQAGITVTGKVTDQGGVPLIGVSVVEDGTTNGVSTDGAGNYTIGVRAGASLVFSYVGYTPQQVEVGSRTTVNIVMQSDITIEEVVVVGYGTLERRSLTNAVSKVTPDDFSAGTSSPFLAIQGKIPGLSITNPNGSGDPNSDASIQLRGINSATGSGQSGPLIVVDGVPGADITMVSKEDIESITVLKDASAAAIYGTRAAGGVMLITTKRPSAGTVTVDVTSEFSWESLVNTPKILSAKHYRDLHKADGGYDYGASTNWIKAVTNNPAFTHRYAATASGGTENARLLASVAFKDAKGTLIGTDRRELNARINGYFRFLDGKFELNTTATYTDLGAHLGDRNIYEKALQANPTYPVYDPSDASGYYMILYTSEMFNPVAEALLKSNKLEKNLLLGSASLRYNITDHWNVTALVAGKVVNEDQIQYRSALHRLSIETGKRGEANLRHAGNIDKTLDITTAYSRRLGDHYVNAVGGYSFQEFNGYGFGMANSNFLVDGLGPWSIGDGADLSDGDAGMNSYRDPRVRLIAFFGRVNYDYMNRYLLTATLRYEGTSKFVKDKWGVFPGISAGWRLSSESFLENASFLDDLKVRASYGQTGNANISSERAYRLYRGSDWTLKDGEWMRIYRVAYNENENLKWEVTKEYNVGVDFSLFGNRLSGRADWFQRSISDLYYAGVPIASPPAIYNTIDANVGKLKSNGLEIELSGVVVDKGDWSYTTSFNASLTTTSKLDYNGLPGKLQLHTLPHPGSPGTAVQIEGNQKIGQFYIWKHAGFSDDGTPLILNRDGDAVPYTEKTEADKRQIGNAIPKAVFGWTHNFRYRNWDLSIFLRSWVGNDVLNVQNMYLGVNNSFSAGRNVLESAFRSKQNAYFNAEGIVMSDYWLENGSFLKLDNVTLGYTLPKGRVKMVRNLRAFATVRNVLTLTKYTGVDPEVNVNGLEPGFGDLNEYPRSRTFMVGLQIGF